MLRLIECLILEKHVELYPPSKSGQNFICAAVIKGHVHVMQFLLEHFGRKVLQKPCDNGFLFVMHAARNESPEMVRWLFRNKLVHPQARYEGMTVLYIAASFYHSENCKIY